MYVETIGKVNTPPDNSSLKEAATVAVKAGINIALCGSCSHV